MTPPFKKHRWPKRLSIYRTRGAERNINMLHEPCTKASLYVLKKESTTLRWEEKQNIYTAVFMELPGSHSWKSESHLLLSWMKMIPPNELALNLAGELIAVIWTLDSRRGWLHWDDSNSCRLRWRASPFLITAHSAHSDAGALLIMGGCSEGAAQRLYSVITSYSDRYLH